MTLSISSYSYSKISDNTGVNSNVYGIRVAIKLVYYSLSPYISLWGTKPPLPCSPSINVVITLNSWHGRVPFNTSSPLKPPFPLSSSAKGLIVRDCHDKRLRFFVFTSDCFPLHLVLFRLFHLFQSKWPFFVYLRNIRSIIEILKIKTSRIFRPSFSAFLSLRPLIVLSCSTGRLRCASVAEWHIELSLSCSTFSRQLKISEMQDQDNRITIAGKQKKAAGNCCSQFPD